MKIDKSKCNHQFQSICCECGEYEADLSTNIKASNFYQAIKDDPTEVLEWIKKEVEAYKELEKLIKSK